ncbi:MAG: SAM-dependent DNA methyltransferase, partial [Planctomycetales bacterium]|nr:SAM-dependent DNA methyltransferase [Planctomycetales bacterium]
MHTRNYWPIAFSCGNVADQLELAIGTAAMFNDTTYETDAPPEAPPSQGQHHAVQNDSSRTDSGSSDAASTARVQRLLAFDVESTGKDTEALPRGSSAEIASSTAASFGSTAEQRSAGTRGSPAAAGFAERVGRRTAVAGRGNGLYPKSNRLTPSNDRPLFGLLDQSEERSAAKQRNAERCGSQSTGPKTKAREIIAAIRCLQQIEHGNRQLTSEERDVLSRFGGFGAVALYIFPDPVTGNYKDDSWQELGNELIDLLSPEEYDSAKRTTFNAFYTSPAVMQTMHQALSRLGVSGQARILEPGCGIGNFMKHAGSQQRFIGVELDSISGRIARALYPEHDIRIENFQDTKLSELDAVIGNVPFADLKLNYQGNRLSLHDYFFAKSVDALKPGGVLALVTSHFTLDKLNGELRERLSNQADFLGAIRLPADAFKEQGTKVVTDIVFLRKR